MTLSPKDMTPVYKATIAKGTNAARWQRAAYVDHLPPCNNACPAGLNSQAWLGHAQAGRYEDAWRKYMEENPLPATHGRACYHPCESACTGFNQIDVRAAKRLGVKVVRVTDYSPNSVAEFAVGLLLALNRKIFRAYNRTREGNFELDGLMGFDLVGRTVGVIGTGKIGTIFARIMGGFGCSVIGYDVLRSPRFGELGGRYVDVETLQAEADIISLHCPLTPRTHHIVDDRFLAGTKKGALLVNTSRGGLIDTEAVIEALKCGQLSGLAIDVYEQEANLFFRDLSNTVIPDDVIQRLVSFPNVILTGHQAFFTREALGTILDTTLASISNFAAGRPLANEIKV